MPTIPRPAPADHAPYQADYIALVAEGDLIAQLNRQAEEVAEFDLDDPEMQSPAPGKWSPRQVFGHLIDGERIMAYRLLRIARGDNTPLEGFDQDAFVASADFDGRDAEDLVAEFLSVRGATVTLLEGLKPEAFHRRGMANGFSVTASALAHVIYGHTAHHLNSLRQRTQK